MATNTIRPQLFKKIVCIGDSITAGHPLHDNDPAVYLDADNPLSQYEAHLALILPDWTIVNKGVGSDTTTGMVNRFTTDVVAENPAYVIILGGVNDISSAVALATIEANLQSMYEMALQNGIMPVACTLLPWNNGTTTQKDTLDQLNAWIRAYARDNQIPLIEFF